MTRSRRRACVLAGILTVAGGTVGAIALASDSPNVDRAAQVRTTPPGKHLFTRANGINPGSARLALTTKSGMTLSVAEGADGRRCLIAGDGTDSCKTPAEVDRGWSMDVSNDCSKLDGAMNVRGMVPARVRTVRLIGGDGTTQDTTVAGGVFNYDMPTPRPGDAGAPVTVAWLDDSGKQVATHDFLVPPGRYCPKP
jgi:hypothetical protein